MKGYCRYCKAEVDETEQANGICLDCMNDILKYPVLFSDYGLKSKDTLITAICERIIDLERLNTMTKEYRAMKDAYIDASNTLEEVHLRLEKLQSDFNILKTMVEGTKNLFQNGWGVPK